MSNLCESEQEHFPRNQSITIEPHSEFSQKPFLR